VNQIAQALKSKTVWYAIVLALLSILQGNLQVFNLTPALQMYAGMAIAAGIVVLRFLTTQPVSEK
jgi:uncharacterized membrane protein YgaE (UPF0421/DUF939 family)